MSEINKNLNSSPTEIEVVAEYKKNNRSSGKNHRVIRDGHADPWKSREPKNRLDDLWEKLPKGRKGEDKAFGVEKKEVPTGDGQVTLKWKVWEDSQDLTNTEVEIYSVMRAEEHYIKGGYKKIASKYWWPVTMTINGEKRQVPVENLGVDNFFKKDDSYIVCESKFTRDEGLFNQWKQDDKKVWQRLGSYKVGTQMSWEWIEDRAAKAAKRPGGTRKLKPNEEIADKMLLGAIEMEIAEMVDAVTINKEKVERIVNVFGASKVPIYPGRYRFKLGSTGRETKNTLHLKWQLEIEQKEFIKLGSDFDNWIATKTENDS